MKNHFLKKCLAMLLILCLGFTFTACGDEEDEEDTSLPTESTMARYQSYAKEGGNIYWPNDLLIPGGSGEMVKQLDEEQGMLVGALSLTTYRSTDYYYINGSEITLIVDMKLNDVTSYTQGTVALWEKGDGVTEFKQVLYFEADGTTQQHTFTGLDSSKQYKLVFSYSDKAYFSMSGQFNVVGFTGELEEEMVVIAE